MIKIFTIFPFGRYCSVFVTICNVISRIMLQYEMVYKIKYQKEYFML